MAGVKARSNIRQMKRKLENNPAETLANSILENNEKMEMLEKTLKIFRAEMDMKMKIVQQILTTRNAQVTVQKKLLDREQNLNTALLAHWLNTPKLASNGVSMHYTANVVENNEHEDYLQEDLENILTVPPGHLGSAAKKPRRKRPKVTKLQNQDPTNPAADEEHGGEEGEPIYLEAETIDVDVEIGEDGEISNADEDWISSVVGVGEEVTVVAGDGQPAKRTASGTNRNTGTPRRSQGRPSKRIVRPFLTPRKRNTNQTSRKSFGSGRKRGEIWGHFQEDPEGSRKVFCNYCQKAISGEAQRMANHLKKCVKTNKPTSPPSSLQNVSPENVSPPQ